MAFHVWISSDEDYVSCLTCGAEFTDSDPSNVSSTIVGHDGESAYPCSGNTQQCHHYGGGHDETGNDWECNRIPDCNCWFCQG